MATTGKLTNVAPYYYDGTASLFWKLTNDDYLDRFSVYPKEGGTASVSSDSTKLVIGGKGCTICELSGPNAPSDFVRIAYKVVISFDGNEDNSYISVKLGNVSFNATEQPGVFYLSKSVNWETSKELSIEIDKACTITGISLYTSIISNSASYDWTSSPVDNGTLNNAKNEDGSININAFEHQGYSYPFNVSGTVTYNSTNTDVATVATDGSITIFKSGLTTITASVHNENDYANDDLVFGYLLSVDFPAPTITPVGGYYQANTGITFSYDATNTPDFKYKWGDDGEVVSYGQTTPTMQTGTLHAWVEVTPQGRDAIKSDEATAKFTIIEGDYYGLTVSETPVTSANYGNVLGDGTVTFTPAADNEPATLTLSGATITGNIEVNNLSALKIKVVGANTITAGEVSAIKSNLSSGSCALTFSRGSNDVDCSLTLNSTGVTAISTGFSGPTYNAMALVAEGEQVDYRSDYGLSNHVGNNVYNPVTSATITSYTTYGIIVAGQEVTSLNKNAIAKNQGANNSISYDEVNNVLTFNNVPRNCFNSSYPFIQTSMDLTINLVGTSEPDMGNVLIQRNANDNETTHTLTFTTDETNPGMFIVRGGTFSHKGFNVVYNNHLAKNASGYFNGTGDDPTDWVAIPKYGLTIAGVEVTEANMGNVLGEELVGDESPSVSFIPATDNDPATLTLNNASITVEDSNEFPCIAYSGNTGLTIKLIGDNSIVNSADVTAIRSNSGGTLTFAKGDAQSCSLQMSTGGDSVIDGFSSILGVNGINEETGNSLALSNVPASYSINNGLYTVDGETNIPVSSATITSGYGLTVAGVLVHEGNKDNVLGDQEETHKVTFTPAVAAEGDNSVTPAMLTLNEVNYSLNDGDKTPLVVSGLDNLTVKLVGSSSVYTSSGAEVYPDAAFVSTNSLAVLTFTTDESTRLQPLNTNSIELASGFKDIVFTGYLYREQNMVKNLLAPTPGMDGKFFTVNRAGYEPEETTFNYVIDYEDNSASVNGTYDMSKTATENNILLNKPCTVTVYAQYGTVKSVEKVGKLFGFEGGNELNTVYGTTQVTMPDLVPAIAEADGITIAKEGNFVDNNKTMIDLSGKTIGKASTTIIATLTASNDTPCTLLNSSVSLNVNILPPAPTIAFDNTKDYLNSDVVSISLPEALQDDPNASIKYSWDAESEPGNASNYTEESKVALNAGTNTLYAWVRYDGATADDAVYSERVSREFTAKTDIDQFKAKDLLENTSVTYTGSVITPTFTLYDAMDETNTLSADNYDVVIKKYMGETTGYTVVESIVDAGKYMVYAVGKGTTYGGEKIIYEWLEVKQADLPSLTVLDDDLTYDGTAQPLITINNVPTGVTVKYYCRQIGEEDYKNDSFNLLCEPSGDDFSDNVPTGKNVGYFALLYKIDGGNNYKSQDAGATIKIAILPAGITELTLSATELPYNGENQTPSIASVKAGNMVLKDNDYTVSYEQINGDETTTEISASDVKAVGSYNVVVTGQGNFTGTAKAPFAILNRTLTEGTDVQFASGQDWATYYNTETEDLMLPNNIAAYVVTGIDGSTVTTQRISKVMCEIPVLLQKYTTAPEAEINDDFDYFSPWKGTTEATTIDNLLEYYVTGAVYVLYNNAFVKATSGTIPAKRGVLVIGEEMAAPRLTIDIVGGTTGVSDARSKKADVSGNFYDLQGRKVEKPSKKGLYINEGHKVVVK